MRDNKNEMDAKYPGVPQMDCIDFLPQVDDLLDLEEAEWDLALARHLEECPACEVFVHQLRDLRRILQSERSRGLAVDDPVITSLIERAAALGPEVTS